MRVGGGEGKAFRRLSGRGATVCLLVAIAASAVLLLFVLSGAAGLIYEVVWARQLVLVECARIGRAKRGRHRRE